MDQFNELDSVKKPGASCFTTNGKNEGKIVIEISMVSFFSEINRLTDEDEAKKKSVNGSQNPIHYNDIRWR